MIHKCELKAFAEPLSLADHGCGGALQPSPDKVYRAIAEENVATVEECRIAMTFVVDEGCVRVRRGRANERMLRA
jgi:hypothetical protein